jgi:hypothetical protein
MNMFILIEYSNEASHEAQKFLEERDFYVPYPAQEYLPFGELLPCLLSFFTGYSMKHEGANGRVEPMLGYHYCTKELAKFLVYNKTNKANRNFRKFYDTNWSYVEVSSLAKFTKFSKQKYGNFRLESGTGFNATLCNCINNSEPFLYHLETSKDREGNYVYHQAIVDLEAAKSLVYYRKNKKFIEEIGTKRLLAFLKRIDQSDAEWAKNKTKVIDYTGKILSMIRKGDEEEISF